MADTDFYEVDTVMEGFDFRLKWPSSFAIIGCTQAGKTMFVLDVIRNAQQLFRNPKCAQNVIYFHSIDQDCLEDAKKEGLIHHLLSEVPTKERMTELTQDYKRKGGSIVVIDDHANSLNKKSIDIFTVLTHHLGCVTFLLSQSLFPKSEAYREISRNVTYTVIFKTMRDFQQFSKFAYQISPKYGKALVQLYENETRRQYSYIFISHDHATPSLLQFRTHILPHEAPMCVYRLKKG